MNARKASVRVLSFLLAFCMVLGMVPVTALTADAESTVIDAAIFCSDVHDNTSKVTSVFSQIKSSGLTYSTATFCGDTFSDSKGSSSTVDAAAESGLGAAIESYFVWGDHDDGSDIVDDTGLVYGTEEGQNYYIYVLSMADMDNDYSAEEAAAEMAAFTSAVESMDKTKPLFIASHQPLHARRSDNIYAAAWTDVINAAAEQMDVVFFWGHNHTGDGDVDRSVYNVAKGSTLNVETEAGAENAGKTGTSSSNTGTDKTINFTYMNAGYIGKSAGRGYVATTVKITADKLIFQDYNTDGAYSGTYAHNVEVDREFANTVTPEETTDPTTEPHEHSYVSTTTATCTQDGVTTYTCECGESYSVDVVATGHVNENGACTVCGALINRITAEISKTQYDLNEAFDPSTLTVTAVYDDDSTMVLADGWTVSEVDTATEGEKEITVTYVSGVTFSTTVTITVENVADEDATLTGIEVTALPQTEYYVGDAFVLDGLTVMAHYDNGESIALEYASFDEEKDGYTLEGYTMYHYTASTVQTVIVSYGGFTDSFDIHVYAKSEDSTVSVLSEGVTAVTYEDVSATVTAAADVLAEGFVAYDIVPSGYVTGTSAKVTMPAAAGANAVYYWDQDNNELRFISDAVFADGMVTFTTDHFSVYVNGELASDSTLIPGTVTLEGYTKAYSLISGNPVVGEEYLIVSATSGTAYALGADVAAEYAVTFSNGYITSVPDGALLWTVGGSSGAYTFTSGSYKLGMSGTSLSTSTESTWSYSSSNNRIYRTYSGVTYYLRYRNSSYSWVVRTNSGSVYLYEETSVTADVDTVVNGVYALNAGADVTKTVSGSAATVALNSPVVTFTYNDTVYTTSNGLTLPTGGTYSYSVVEDESSIISSVSDGTVNLTGTTGTATVRVTYSWTYNGTSYAITDDVTVTAKTSSSTTVTGESGLFLDKNVVLNDDGTYTITLEAFSTGASVSTSSTTTAPVDVILVLDMSQSMISNNISSGNTSITRKQALLNAVNSFANAIFEKAGGADKDITTTDDNVSHRLSIVQFNSSGTVRCALKDASTSAGQQNISDAIEALSTSSNTKPDLGMEQAKNVFAGTATGTVDNAGNDSVTDAEGVTRQRVVVFFTDGYPATSSGEKFHAVYASGAIAAAYELKNSYNATVYSVAVLDTADPTAAIVTSAQTSFGDRINCFLHAVSSNYPQAQCTSYTSGDSGTITVTLGTAATNKKYYLVASTADQLNNIFTDITTDIDTSSTSITLDSTSVMKDIIGAEFTVPAGVDFKNVSMMVVDGSTSDGEHFTFGTSASETFDDTLTYTVVENSDGSHDINITGFSYKDYYITSNKQGDYADEQYKLIVTISNIMVADDVATNTVFNTNGTGSGLYEKDATEAAAKFPQPKSVVTSKLYVVDYAKEVELDKADWYAKNINLNYNSYISGNSYGTFSANDSKSDEDETITFGDTLTYTPQTMQWDGYDTAYVVGAISDAFRTAYPTAVDEATGANINYVLSKVSVIPANNVYYEDSFVSGQSNGNVDIKITSGFTFSSEWTENKGGSNTENPEDDETTENGGNMGWEDSLSDDKGFSDGSYHMATTAGATASFTFTGTGVDVYTYTDMQSGIVIGMLYKNDATVATKALMVDNLAVSGAYYQIPTLSFQGLEYSTTAEDGTVTVNKYTVKIYVSSGKAVGTDENGNYVDEDGNIIYDDEAKRSTYYLDGIRIYNPLGSAPSDENVQEAYGGLTSTFLEVRDLMNDDESGESLVFIDLDDEGTKAAAKEYDKTEYGIYGPKNEVYLAAGQAIVFKVDVSATNRYFVGLKSPTGENVVAEFDGGYANVTHTTDLYYEVFPDVNGYVTILNEEESTSILSVTKIQILSGVSTNNLLETLDVDEAVKHAVAVAASKNEDSEVVDPEVNPGESAPSIEIEIENPAEDEEDEQKREFIRFVIDLFASLSNWFN